METWGQLRETSELMVPFWNVNVRTDTEASIMQSLIWTKRYKTSKANWFTVDYDLLQQGKVEAWSGAAGCGVGVSANLIDAKAFVFDLIIGVGLDSGPLFTKR